MNLLDFTAKLWPKIFTEPNSGCWLWDGAWDKDGYGKVKVMGKTLRPHRLAYEALIGRIPDGLIMDHLCRVRCCCNPWHLEPVTNQENVRRAVRGPNIGKHKLANTHCPHGHPYSGSNLRYAPSGQRVCRQCTRENMRRYRADGRCK